MSNLKKLSDDDILIFNELKKWIEKNNKVNIAGVAKVLNIAYMKKSIDAWETSIRRFIKRCPKWEYVTFDELVRLTNGDDLPSKYILESQKLRNRVLELERVNRELKHITLSEQALFEAIKLGLKVLPLVESIPSIYPQVEKPVEEEVVLMLTDHHINKVISLEETEGYNSYNFSIFCNRYWFIINDVIKLTNANRLTKKIEVLHIDMLGDMFNDIHRPQHVRSNQFNPVQAVILGSYVLAQGIAMLVPYFEKIYFTGIVGNEARLDAIKPSEQKFNNFDYLAYHVISMCLAKYVREKKIFFNIPLSPEIVVERMGYKFLLTHGDAIKSWMGIPYYGIERHTYKQQQKRRSKGGYDYLEMGHFHTDNKLKEVLMGGSICFPAGERVITQIGAKNIEDVQIGDLVLTHLGRFRSVEKTFVRDYTGPLQKLYFYNGERIWCTPDHPIFSAQVGGSLDVKCAKDLTFFDYLKLPRFNLPETSFSLDLATVLKGEELLEVKEKTIVWKMQRDCANIELTRNVYIDYEFGKLLGLYLAEGSLFFSKTSSHACVSFTFHQKEMFYVEELKEIIRKKFGEDIPCNLSIVTDRHVLNVRFSSVVLTKLIQKFCGELSHTKRISPEIFLSNQECRRGILDGFIMGDGHNSSSRSGTYVSCITVSLDLAYQLCSIAIDLGMYPRLKKMQMNKRGVYPAKWGYSLVFSNRDYEQVVEAKVDGVKFRGVDHYDTINIIRKEDSLFVRLRRDPKADITPVRKNIKVYNLQVEEDNSYCVNYVAVHNCGADMYTFHDLAIISPPTQKFFGINKKYGVSWQYDLNCAEAKTNGFVYSTSGLSAGDILVNSILKD